MFHIIGADGKEYGPVPADTLRGWLTEGRAGATTKVRPDGSADWVELKSLPEFSAAFHPLAPAVPSSGRRVPPIVATLAWAMFAVTAVSALLTLVNLISLMNIPASANFHPGAAYYFHWAIALLSLPARVVAGLGLLRGKEWARRFAVGLGVALLLMGGFGLATMVQTWIARPQMFPGVLMSPLYVISTLWSITLFLFNLATVVVLLRGDVRRAFAAANSPRV
jgi:hypothetical protein